MTITFEQLEEALVTAYPGASYPVLPRAVAVQRARWLYDDLQARRFDLRLIYQPIEFDGCEPMHVPKYRLADSPFNASKASDERKRGEDLEIAAFGLRASRSTWRSSTVRALGWPEWMAALMHKTCPPCLMA